MRGCDVCLFMVLQVQLCLVLVQTTPHRTHTRALFLASHARTQDVLTRLAQGLDVLFVRLKSHFIIGHFFVGCSLNPQFLYFLITHGLTDATDWNQIEPLCNSALGWTVWPSGRSDPTGSSASMSVASTRRSTFRPGT